MEWLNVRPAFTRFLSGAVFWLVLTLVLASMSPAQGQNVAQPPWRGHLALASRGHPGLALAGDGAALASQAGQADSKRDPSRPGTGDGLAIKEQGQDALATAGSLRGPATLGSESLPPAVTVERRGRLLVLTYGSKSAGSGLSSNANPRDEPLGFVVYQGQWPIASGRFEFG